MNGQQGVITINGTIVDEQSKPLDYVTVKLLNTDRLTYTDAKGKFSFVINPGILKQITISAAMVGKVSNDTTIISNDYQKQLTIKLKTLNLSLNEVQVSAVRKSTGLSNSSILFDRQAIEQVQAFSLVDILNNLPGKTYAALDLQGAKNLTLRSDATGNSSLNNALGTAIIIDGLVQSNNANMQNKNIGKYGLETINDRANGRSYDVTFGGIDLREIPADNIESIEVISGIAPAQYGDLTDGAVIINRQAGRTDFQFSTRFNGGSTNFSLSKGFKLNGKLGSLNANLNYLNSNDDPRDLLKKYKRVSGGLMWTGYFAKGVKNTLSFDFSEKLDDAKEDPDDGKDWMTYSKNRRFAFSERLSAEVNGKFLRRINLSIGADISSTESYTQWWLSGSPKPTADKDTTGVYEGFYTDGNFNAVDQIVGKPMNLNANLSFLNQFYTGKIKHSLSVGGSFSLSSNKGQGVLFDSKRPRWAGRNSQNERPYNFELIPSLINTGVYLEDKFSLKLFSKLFDVSAGLRYDDQNGFGTFQPRINSSYAIAKDLKLNMAYGIATKAPTMAYRYPSPTYFDVLLLNYFTGNAKTDLLLVYTEKHVPDNKDLKPSKSTQFELGLSWDKKKFSTSIFGYIKNNTDGFYAQQTFYPMVIPIYQVIPNSGGKPGYFDTGKTRIEGTLDANTIKNGVSSENYGIEWFISTKKIKAIQSSFSFNSSFSLSNFHNVGYTVRAAAEDDILAEKKAWYGIYESTGNRNWSLTSRLNSDTHIPKFGFVVSLYADVIWQQYLKNFSAFKNPIAYLDKNGNYYKIDNFDAANPDYGHLLPRPTAVDGEGKLPFPYANLSLRLSKEIKKRIRLSINAYNFLNIQPNYYNTLTKKRTTYNNPTSVGAELTIKF